MAGPRKKARMLPAEFPELLQMPQGEEHVQLGPWGKHAKQRRDAHPTELVVQNVLRAVARKMA